MSILFPTKVKMLLDVFQNVMDLLNPVVRDAAVPVEAGIVEQVAGRNVFLVTIEGNGRIIIFIVVRNNNPFQRCNG